MATKIEWVDTSWNPIVGCSKISTGCDNCFAAKMAGRLANMGQKPYMEVVRLGQPVRNPFHKSHKGKFIGVWNGTTFLVESALDKPYHWKKPWTIFVCSMSDLFHETVPFEWIDKVIDVIVECPQHTFKILTKRPEILKQYSDYNMAEAIPNIWLGVTAENQEQADKRIPILLQIPAAKRFVSIEPMLGPINLTDIDAEMAGHEEYIHINSLTGQHTDMGRPCNPVNKLDWVICGSESGHNRRPMNESWVRDLKNQCIITKTPFFLKQMHCEADGKKIKMPLFDGYVWNQRP